MAMRDGTLTPRSVFKLANPRFAENLECVKLPNSNKRGGATSSYNTDMHLNLPCVEKRTLDQSATKLEEIGGKSLISPSSTESKEVNSEINSCANNPTSPVEEKQMFSPERAVTGIMTGKRSRSPAAKGKSQENDVSLPSPINSNFKSIKHKIRQGEKIPEKQIDELVDQCSGFPLLPMDADTSLSHEPRKNPSGKKVEKRWQLGAFRARRSREKRKKRLACMEKIAVELADILSQAAFKLSSDAAVTSRFPSKCGMSPTNSSSDLCGCRQLLPQDNLSCFKLRVRARSSQMDSEESMVANVLYQMQRSDTNRTIDDKSRWCRPTPTGKLHEPSRCHQDVMG
eukprot:gb/GECG01005110.1/.p1 GENE.gb/GECG01005110.1/~~gb/GECG01005110.1/.p1  ORF type:complete len:342 (+),score=35.32 gb/GECG01005110.1/:1-1026(+)